MSNTPASSLEFEVIQESHGSYVAACYKEKIYTEGNSLAELQDNINTAVNKRFAGTGRLKPTADAIRLIVYKETPSTPDKPEFGISNSP